MDKYDKAFQEGQSLGEYMRQARLDGDCSYDPRWDFADAAKEGVYQQFKAGFDKGFDEGPGEWVWREGGWVRYADNP